MESTLDDEFVIQMDDSPPFSWIRQTPNRFMSCALGRKIDHLEIGVIGNSLLMSKMARDVIGKEKLQAGTFSSTSSGEDSCIISYSGQLRDALRALEAANHKGIVISSGGMIKKLARSKGWDYLPLPKGYPTMFLFPEIFGCLLSLYGMKVDIPDMEEFIESNSPSEIIEVNEAKRLAMLLDKEEFRILYDEKSEGLATMYTRIFKSYSGMNFDTKNVEDINSRIEEGKDNLRSISFVGKGASSEDKLVGNFPYDCNSVAGYVKNFIIAQFASLYLGILRSKEIELFDREVE